MRKLAGLIVVVIFLNLGTCAFAEEFYETALGQQLVTLGLKFLDDPGDFFFNLHTSNEDFTPVPDGKRGVARFNFLPTFLPLTWANINGKVKVLDDKGYVPQVDLAFMYGDIVALRMMSASAGEDEIKPTFNDYSIGAIASKATNDKTKIFGGFRHSVVNLSVQLSSANAVEFGEFRMDSIDFRMADTMFFTGIMHKTGEHSHLIASAGYAFKYKKIVSRIAMYHRRLEVGMDIFPEGLFVIQPFMAWHWYF